MTSVVSQPSSSELMIKDVESMTEKEIKDELKKRNILIEGDLSQLKIALCESIERVCPITYSQLDLIQAKITLSCGHTFVTDGLHQWSSNNASCPCCRTRIPHIITRRSRQWSSFTPPANSISNARQTQLINAIREADTLALHPLIQHRQSAVNNSPVTAEMLAHSATSIIEFQKNKLTAYETENARLKTELEEKSRKLNRYLGKFVNKVKSLNKDIDILSEEQNKYLELLGDTEMYKIDKFITNNKSDPDFRVVLLPEKEKEGDIHCSLASYTLNNNKKVWKSIDTRWAEDDTRWAEDDKNTTFFQWIKNCKLKKNDIRINDGDILYDFQSDYIKVIGSYVRSTDSILPIRNSHYIDPVYLIEQCEPIWTSDLMKKYDENNDDLHELYCNGWINFAKKDEDQLAWDGCNWKVKPEYKLRFKYNNICIGV